MVHPNAAAVIEDDLEQLRALVSAVLERSATPDRLRRFDEAEEFDEQLYQDLAAAGLVALEADAEGAPAHHSSEAAVLLELGATATSMAVEFVVQYMGVRLFASLGTPPQRERVLEPLLEGRTRVAFALTEPDGGTDVLGAMRTRATRAGDGWTLAGEKTWISGATTADHLIVLARTDAADGTAGRHSITMFIVDREAAGVTVDEIDTVAIHGLSTCTVGLDDVRVGSADVIGDVGEGFRQVLAVLNAERMNAAAVALGIARGALDAASEYASQRHAFGRPIGALQALQHRLADGVIAVEGAQALLDRALALADSGQDAAVASAIAKVAASDAATSVSDTGMRVLGAMGLSRDHPMQRFFRDARLYTFAPVSDEMARNFIAERRLGLPRSY